MATGSYGGTLISGIQDISALLPLLGTEQCEGHATSALTDGFLFAAATPLSIFGTLGLARAGFKAAFASIVIPSWGILGAEKLRDAGFKPSGKNLELIMMDPSNRDRYLVETRLCERLKDRHLENNGQVRVFFEWEVLGWWNVKMVLATAAFSIANLTAYIELILHNDNRLPLRLRLIFPITRILGCFLTTVSLQILIQRRMVNIIHARELFGRMDHAMRTGIQDRDLHMIMTLGDGAIGHWDTKIASDKCLSSMQSHSYSRIPGFLRHIIIPLLRWLSGRSELDDLRRQGVNSQNQMRNFMTEFTDDVVVEWPFILLTLLGGFGCVVGYIGCFSIVQGYRGSLRGPLIWLLVEATLSFFRILIWGLNPTCDDAPPLKLKDLDFSFRSLWGSQGPFVTQSKPPRVENEKLVLEVLRAGQFFQSLRRHSGISVQPLAFPDSSLLYSLVQSQSGQQLDLYIVIVDHVDQTARVYLEDNAAPKFRLATLTVSHVRDAVELDGCQVRVASVVVGQLIPDEAEDHITSNEDLRSTLQDHYRSILRAAAGDGPRGGSMGSKYGPLNWELTSWL